MKIKRKRLCAWKNYKYQLNKFVKEGKAFLNNLIQAYKKKEIKTKTIITVSVFTVNKKLPNFKCSDKQYLWSFKPLNTLTNSSKAKWCCGQTEKPVQKNSNPFFLNTLFCLKSLQSTFCYLIVMHRIQMEFLLTFFATKWESSSQSTLK